MKNTQVGDKVRIKGKPIKGVSFRVIAIDKWRLATIQHSISGVAYEIPCFDLEVLK